MYTYEAIDCVMSFSAEGEDALRTTVVIDLGGRLGFRAGVCKTQRPTANKQTLANNNKEVEMCEIIDIEQHRKIKNESQEELKTLEIEKSDKKEEQLKAELKKFVLNQEIHKVKMSIFKIKRRIEEIKSKKTS